MTMAMEGREFHLRHAAGVTKFRVVRPHRDAGYYKCVSVAGVKGSHHCIEVFHGKDILDCQAAYMEPGDVVSVLAEGRQ